MFRDYVERHRRLDVRELHRRGALVAEEDKITLHYKTWKAESQEIYLEWTSCNYGGRRPWFTCWCTKRVAVLYLAGKWFLCRKCHRLIHRSVNRSKHSRAYHKMLKIRKRLGYDSNIMEPILFKPKGMHYTTFRRLLDEYEAADEIHSRPLINAFIRWGRKVGHPLCRE